LEVVDYSPSTGTTYTGISHSFSAENTNYQIKMCGTSITDDPSFDNCGKCGFGFSRDNTSEYDADTNKSKIISIDSDIMSLIQKGTELGDNFLLCGFHGCTSLISISDDFLSGVTGQQGSYFLYSCFRNCTSLISIPDDFLNGITGQQDSNFLYGCFFG
jgi:hypothetical protein